MTIILNTSVATDVTNLARIKGELITDPESGLEYYEDLGVMPGCRLDVHSNCIVQNPGLAAYVVEPANPVHDCGLSGVRLFANSLDDFIEAAPPGGNLYDIFIEVNDQELQPGGE